MALQVGGVHHSASGKRLAVDPLRKEGQFIRRFFHREPFDVRPGIPCLVLSGDFRIGERVHFDVPRGCERAREIKERAHREAYHGTVIDHASTQRCR